MIVCMQSVAVVAERGAPVCRFPDHAAALQTGITSRLAANIDDAGISWIDRDRHVIEALARAESATASKLGRPRRTAIKGIDLFPHRARVGRRTPRGISGRLTSGRVRRHHPSNLVNGQTYTNSGGHW